MTRRNALTALLLGSFSLLGCSATKAYEGNQRSSSDVARVAFYSSVNTKMQTSNLRIDGVEQGIFDMGLDVLPGEHKAEVDYSFSEEDCYSTWKSFCFSIDYTGQCHGNVRTDAGKKYSIKLSRVGTSVYYSAIESDSGDSAGSGSCETDAGTPSYRNAPTRF